MATDRDDKKNLLERFDNITLNLLHSDLDSAKEFLKENGLNPDEELQFGLKQLKKLQFIANAKIKEANDKNLLEVAFLKLKKSFEANAEKAGEVLYALLHAKNPALQYHKLEKWTDDEIRDVLQDLDLVQLMEELEKDC